MAHNTTHTTATFTGLAVDLEHPRPDQIHPDDIAHSLSQTCRFGGHSRRFYSVAEHSVLVADVAAAAGADPTEQLIALMHDAHKAYLGDIPSPIKAMLSDYPELSRKLKAAIAQALRLPEPTLSTPRVEEAELFVGAFETEQMMVDTRPQFAAESTQLSLPAGVTWHAGLAPNNAELVFCQRFDQLNVSRRA